ncbi:unnamed protein product [Echinostoma caproni]|uniref:EF-hand domain-containing protein n=1 Tax=Echinostoma caproni TaxID=27848 RepID=A0A183A7J4_9TREM|nr:unnamed protein product [Echinostoma caproni]
MKVDDLQQFEIEKIQKGFRFFDKDNTGFIPSSELGNALRWLCLIPSEHEIESFREELDPDQTGMISWLGFLKVAARIWWRDTTLEAHVTKAFWVFDKADTGSIPLEEMKNILTNTGLEPIPVKEAEKFVRRYEAIPGFFHYLSFVRDAIK